MASIETACRRWWLYSAACLTVARFFDAEGPSHDLSYQILAAHNLLAGRGLSIYQPSSANIADPSTLVTLTHFPAGYSLMAAALLGTGLHVGVVIKLLGAVATMLGWWGWARLSSPFFEPGLHSSRFWRSVAFAMATAVPLLFTPAWFGTDLFLWAAVPWVIECLSRAAKDTTRSWQFDVCAGSLCGGAIFMRYASIFLAAYAGALIMWQSWPRLAHILRRAALFAIGIAPLLVVQLTINLSATGSRVIPAGISLENVSESTTHRLLSALSQLHTWNVTWSFWMPGKALTVLFPDPPPTMPWQLMLTALAFVCLVWAGRVFRGQSAAPASDLRLLSINVLTAIPVFLFTVMLLGRYSYVGDRRYYVSAVPLSLFVIYAIAMTPTTGRGSAFAAFRWGSRAYCVVCATLLAVFLLLLPTPTALGQLQREKLMSAAITQWPSFAIPQELSPARQATLALVREHPGAILLTSRLAYFVWDKEVDGSRLLGLSCAPLKASHAGGPATFVILTFDRGQEGDLWEYVGNGITGTEFRAGCFEGLQPRTLVRRFPDEGMKLLIAGINASEDVPLQPSAIAAVQ